MEGGDIRKVNKKTEGQHKREHLAMGLGLNLKEIRAKTMA